MTRQQIIAAAEQITKAIDNAGISELFSAPADSTTLQDFLKAFKQYNILAEQFSEGALFLEKELGFSPLRDPDPWIVMSKQSDLDGDNPLSNIKGVVDTLTSISNLLIEHQESLTNQEDKEVLSLILFENDLEAISSPRRISDSLESIEQLYEACARMQGLPFDDLKVISCDSGNDKLFDFLGKASIIGAAKELILSIWERVIFYRNRNLQERISLLTHSLPVLDNVTELEMSGSISTADGEKTRNAIVNGVTKFLSSGSMIKEIQERTTFDERSLMAPAPIKVFENGRKQTPPPPPPEPQPEPKPVSAPPPKAEETIIPPPPPPAEPEEDLSWDGILEDDLKTLRELIDKTKRSEEEHG